MMHASLPPTLFLLPSVLLAIAVVASQPSLAFPPSSSSSSATPRLLDIRGGSDRSGASALFASISRRNLLAGIGGSILSIPLAGEVYARLGSRERDVATLIFGDGNDDSVDPLSVPTDAEWKRMEDVTLVFHGAGGQDMYTDELMTNLRAKCVNNKRQYAAMIDWSSLSSNILQASFNGQRVGREVARRLLTRCCTPHNNSSSGGGALNLKTVHLIGISVGAFAANEACVVLKSTLGSKVFVQLTLLDPFQQRGVVGTGYGNAFFGKTADYAVQYLNTDDPVPSTNAPLTKYCGVVDITRLRPESIFGHDWPVAYYGGMEKRRNAGARSVHATMGIVPEKDRIEPGTVIVL